MEKRTVFILGIIVLVLVSIMLPFKQPFVLCYFRSGRAEYNELIKIPMTEEIERTRKLESYSTEKQIDIFLCAARCERDPSIMGIFDNTGESKITQIVERIRTSESAADKYYMSESLTNIDWKCRCINQTTIDQLSKFTSDVSIMDPESQKFYKEGYKNNLELITKLNNQIRQ